MILDADDVTYVLVSCYKLKTAYDMRISDCSSDVCSSDLLTGTPDRPGASSPDPFFSSSLGGRHGPDSSHRMRRRHRRCLRHRCRNHARTARARPRMEVVNGLRPLEGIAASPAQRKPAGATLH